MREIIADSRMMHIGKNGEGDALRVVFPVVAEWEALYGAGGVWTLNVQRHGDALAYAAQDFTIEDGAALWVVTDADAAVVGEGRCELTYKIGDTVAKSRTYSFRVDRSLTGGGDVPDPVKGWQETLEERVNGKLDRPDGGSAGDVLTKTEAGEEWKKPTGGDYNLTDEDKKEIAAEIIENGEQAELGGTPVIAPETAEVGQIIKVKAVDENGKPTQWEAGEMPSGGVAKQPALLSEIILEEAAAISVDMDDTSRGYAEYVVKYAIPKAAEAGVFLKTTIAEYRFETTWNAFISPTYGTIGELTLRICGDVAFFELWRADTAAETPTLFGIPRTNYVCGRRTIVLKTEGSDKLYESLMVFPAGTTVRIYGRN